ncbi:esterase [Putridiphycobacter roseus]|uniref:Esterase n=1 Tax=Putridiphycobacter roseus TaxID=2219161 RepID=A0A2W1N4F3_9FLAO|nr:alpha/beta hydrolase [Putridiphycobacter roseus]PZE17951.1 esterase [Putridiphycobacter roseus]
MKQSLSYYLTLLVLQLKGLKKEFSEDPINYEKLRNEDVHHPKASFFKKEKIKSFKVRNTSITEVSTNKSNGKLLLYIHGGAFISGPSQIHWAVIKKISKQTNFTIWMCDYPKAPENKIIEISANIDAVYQASLEKYQAHDITLIGDSVGGTLIACLLQRLILKQNAIPNKIILISPVMDASFSNPQIDKIDKTDPMLSKTGVLSAKKMCAMEVDLKNPIISPLYGNFEHFPKTVLYLAEHDITYPDQQLAVQKLKNANVPMKVIAGKNMPHIWPLLPLMKEATHTLHDLIDEIKAQ